MIRWIVTLARSCRPACRNAGQQGLRDAPVHRVPNSTAYIELDVVSKGKKKGRGWEGEEVGMPDNAEKKKNIMCVSR